MPLEVWKAVRGYEGFYEVSNLGRVRALFTTIKYKSPGRILKPWLLRNGYLQVHLKPPGRKRVAQCVHVLLLEAFMGPAPENCEVRHLNGTRADNVLTNLAWGTHLENTEDSRRHGTMIAGERAGSSKLTNASVLRIRELWEQEVPSSEIAKQFNIDRTNVWQIATRKTWRHL